MAWSVNAVRKGEVKRVGDRFSFPDEAVGARPGSKFYIAPWTLETLVNEALFYPPAPPDAGKLLNTYSWDAFVNLFNLIGEVENSQSVNDVLESGILQSIPRIAWRQFVWQTGFKSADRVFRAWWMYNFPEANDYFIEKYGISLEKFCFIGFLVAAVLRDFPAIKTDASFKEFGVDNSELDAFMRMVSASSVEARRITRVERSNRAQIAYGPSLLRRKPLISIVREGSTEAFCPLDELLFYRITDGIFYDIVGSDHLRQVVGKRLETYTAEILNHYLSHKYRIESESVYGARSKPRATPDFRLFSDPAKIETIIEVKGRRMPFGLRASPDPYQTNASDHDEIAKGVLQIWRYASDVRLDAADQRCELSPDAIGVVLTLDPWLQMSNDTIQKVLVRAEELAHLSNAVFEEQDRIPVAFVSMDDWESCLRRICAGGFLSALRRHAMPDRHGYLLATSIEEVEKEWKSEVKPYDYQGNLGRVAPWWEELKAMKKT